MLGAARGLDSLRRKPHLRERERNARFVEVSQNARKFPERGEKPAVRPLSQRDLSPLKEQQHRALLDPARFFLRAHGKDFGETVFVCLAHGTCGADLALGRAVRQAHGRAEIHHRLIVRAGAVCVDGRIEPLAEKTAHLGIHDVLAAAAHTRGDAQQIPVHRGDRLAEVDRGDGGGGVVADARERFETCTSARQLAAKVRDDDLRRLLQIPRPRVVAEPLPELQEPFLRHGG